MEESIKQILWYNVFPMIMFIISTMIFFMAESKAWKGINFALGLLWLLVLINNWGKVT